MLEIVWFEIEQMILQSRSTTLLSVANSLQSKFRSFTLILLALFLDCSNLFFAKQIL